MLDVDIYKPLYISPSIIVGSDPSGELVAVIRRVGEPTLKELEFVDRATKLCDLEYLEEPFFLKGKWHVKLKTKEQGDG